MARRYVNALKTWRADYTRHLDRKNEKAYSIVEELALIDTMLEKLVRRAEEGDVPSWRVDVKAAFASLRGAAARGDAGALTLELDAFGALLERGASADDCQVFLRSELERRANLALRGQDVDTRKSEQVTRGQAVALFREFFKAIRIWCFTWACPKCGEKDRNAYASVSAPLFRLVGGMGVEDDGEVESSARAGGARSRAG